jgi:hypothetical protein
MSIADAAMQVFGLFSFDHSLLAFPPVLLERKKKQMLKALDSEKGLNRHPNSVRERGWTE